MHSSHYVATREFRYFLARAIRKRFRLIEKLTFLLFDTSLNHGVTGRGFLQALSLPSSRSRGGGRYSIHSRVGRCGPAPHTLILFKKVTVYAPVCTTNPQIPVVICCIHLHIHHMSRILFLILSFLDFVAFVVKTLISP